VKELSFKSVFTPFFLLIFSAMFISTLSDQIISLKVEKLVSSPNGLNDMIWVWGALSLFTAVFFPMLFAILCSYSIVKTPTPLRFESFFENNIELSVIENLRSWGKSFMWSFLLILPGLAKFILYTLTPYVVLFSKNYKEGKVDALEYSSLVCKKYLKEVNLWLTVFYLGIPILLYVIAEPYRLLRYHPLAGTAVVFVKTLTEYGFHYMMLRIFINFINQNENELVPEPAIAVNATELPAEERGNNGSDV
jgi:hypothetical protein